MKHPLLALLLLAAPLVAQHAALSGATPLPIPPGELLKIRAPQFATWSVVSRPASTAATNSDTQQVVPPKQEVIVTKTKSIYREQIVTAQGGAKEKWCVGDVQYLIGPQQTLSKTDRAAFERGAAQQGSYTDYSKTDFPGLEWVSPKNFKEVIRLKKKDYIVCADRLSLLSDEEFKELQADLASSGDRRKLDRREFEIDVRAMVDLETRLPVMLERGMETWTYQFLPPPSGILSLPVTVERDKLNQIKQAEFMARRPARPY